MDVIVAAILGVVGGIISTTLGVYLTYRLKRGDKKLEGSKATEANSYLQTNIYIENELTEYWGLEKIYRRRSEMIDECDFLFQKVQ